MRSSPGQPFGYGLSMRYITAWCVFLDILLLVLANLRT